MLYVFLNSFMQRIKGSVLHYSLLQRVDQLEARENGTPLDNLPQMLFRVNEFPMLCARSGDLVIQYSVK